MDMYCEISRNQIIVFNRTHIYFYHTPALAEYSITSYIYVTVSLRTTAEVCVAMT